jgi:hypothetical protein
LSLKILIFFLPLSQRIAAEGILVTTLSIETFSAPWNPDPGGLWTLTSTPDAGYIGTSGMQIVSNSGLTGDPTPFAQRQFPTAVDLSAYDELRFWFRSTRRGDGSPTQPFYLILEADVTPPSGVPWSRLLPVHKPQTWELHRLWLADMLAAMRSAVGVMRLRSLNPEIAFVASIDSLIATTPDPIQDVEAALLARWHNQFRVTTGDGSTSVPALFDVPEIQQNPGLPYILITPWSLRPSPAEREGGELIDNFSAQGAYVRPPPGRLHLQYSLDVFAAERAQKARLFEQILRDLLVETHVTVNNERLEIVSFAPAAELTAVPTAARRTPIFCEVAASMDVIPRQFQPWAVPLLYTAPLDGREVAELTVP